MFNIQKESFTKHFQFLTSLKINKRNQKSTFAKFRKKEKYIKNRGFKDEHYKKMILDYIRQYDFATKTNIDHLVLDILPAVLDEKQKANKVRNLIYALSKRDKYIENQGTVRYPKWALTSSKLQNQDEL